VPQRRRMVSTLYKILKSQLTTSRVPSILIQLFWTVFVGPWLLWKIRTIKDVHSWAWQTRVAIIAGFVHSWLYFECSAHHLVRLPGTPLWILFTYSTLPAISNINSHFPPAGWYVITSRLHIKKKTKSTEQVPSISDHLSAGPRSYPTS